MYYYIAYGSNMNIEQMSRRCPNARIIGNGKLNGYKLIFNIHADVINGNDNDVVPVVVWTIDKDDLKSLDIYEGYPEYYTRKNIEVEMDNGTILNGIIYVMNKKRKGICPPFIDYFNVCKQGYEDNNIDISYIYDALEYSINNETKYNKYSIKG